MKTIGYIAILLVISCFFFTGAMIFLIGLLFGKSGKRKPSHFTKISFYNLYITNLNLQKTIQI